MYNGKVKRYVLIFKILSTAITKSAIFITGRARADDAQYVLVTDANRNAAQREQMNQIRENMMNKAIEEINRMEKREFNQKIYEFQMEALREQQLAAEAQRITEIRKAARLDAGEFELRCMKCDNFAAISTDFRQIKGTHHVVVDKDFFKRVHVEPHPNPIRVDFYIKQGKIFCKECRYDWGIKAVYKNVGFQS